MASLLIHTPFLDSVSGSHATGMGILGYRYTRMHNWVVQAVSSFYTAEKEVGRGIVGRPLPTKRESRAVWVTPGHQRLLVYTRAPTSAGWIRSSASSCLYQVIDNSSFIPGHQRFLVYTRSSMISCLYQGRSELFTPVAAV